jgi:hypothetical protein
MPANPRQEFEGAKRRVEFPEHDQPRRTPAGQRPGVPGGACEFRRVSVREKLLDERPPQVPIGLDNENRLAVGHHLLPAYLMASDAHQSQLVKMPSAPRRQNAPVQCHRDAMSLKALDDAAQCRWLHVTDFGLEFGVRQPLVVVVAEKLQDDGALSDPGIGGKAVMLDHGDSFWSAEEAAPQSHDWIHPQQESYGSSRGIEGGSSVSTGRAGVPALARPLGFLVGVRSEQNSRRIARSQRNRRP